MNTQSVGIEWVAAVLAPWTISPHPNFAGGPVLPHQGLALVTEQRERNRDTEDRELQSAWPEWAAETVDAARMSLGLSTQGEGTARLWRLAAEESLPPGARAAAAMYAGLGSLEMEQASDAVDRLTQLLMDFTSVGDPSSAPSSYRLIVGVVAQHRVMRAQDAARFDEARSGVADVVRWLPRVDSTDFEEFEVSKGISWGASRVQKDILVATKHSALASKADIEQLAGDAWVQVVRGRSGWIDMRHYLLERNRNASVVRDSFENKFDSTSGKRVLMRESAADAAYSALLAAELSGNSARARGSRAEMAKVHLLAAGNRDFRTREALRLLRHAQAVAPLKSALSWVRAEGPLKAIRDDALAIIERAIRDRHAAEADLLVLENATDTLESSELARAVEVPPIFLATQARRGRNDWSQLDVAWRAMVRLLPGSGKDDQVASLATELLSSSKILSRPLSSTITRLVAQIDWAQVSPDVKTRWSQWLSAQQNPNVEIRPLVAEVSAALGLESAQLPAVSGLELAAVLADDGLPEGADSQTLEVAREAIASALKIESRSASNGTFAFGGPAPANVAVAFSFRFPEMDIWDEVVEHLLDSNILASQKEDALDRLASNSSRVPDKVRRQLGNARREIADSPRDGMFGGQEFSVFPEAVRMAAAFRALTPTEGLEAVLKLYADGESGKIEASRCLPFVVGDDDATWAHVLLLQLADDRNPNVRAEAGYAMVQLLDARSSVNEMIMHRLEELLGSDGIRCSLRVIHGFQAIVGDRPQLVLPWMERIEMLAEKDDRRVVRGAARELVRLIQSANFGS